MKQKKSQVTALLDLVWENANEAVSHSWERLNHAMRGALELAIGAGFTFESGDIAYIFQNYRSGYWLGDSDEWIYCKAIMAGNMTAIKSYEAAKGREPFITEGVDLNGGSNSYQHGGGGTRQGGRLAVGFSFNWEGQAVKVTSFAADQSYIVACSYKTVTAATGLGRRGYKTEKVSKRFKITREELLRGRAYERERRALLERIRQASPEANEKIVQALGNPTTKKFGAMRVERIRNVVDKYAPKPPTPAVKITQNHIDRIKERPVLPDC